MACGKDGNLSDDLAEIRRGVTDLGTALALHDQKVDGNVARIAESQERVAAAIERIGDATTSIQALTEQMRANGNNTRSPAGSFDKRLIGPGLVVLLLAAVAAGGGAELVSVLLGILKK